MTDTARTQADLLTNLFQDGQSGGAITAQDVRDLIVSVTPSYMGLYFSSASATTISVAGTYYKAAGTTTDTNSSSDMDNNSASNRIRYTGTPTRHFMIRAQASVSPASGTNQDISIRVYHYDASAGSGSTIAHSEAHHFIAGTNKEQIVALADVAMDTNDYLEVYITNNTGTVNLTVDEGYLSAYGFLA